MESPRVGTLHAPGLLVPVRIGRALRCKSARNAVSLTSSEDGLSLASVATEGAVTSTIKTFFHLSLYQRHTGLPFAGHEPAFVANLVIHLLLQRTMILIKLVGNELPAQLVVPP